MRPNSPAKHFILPLIFALVIYSISYGWIEHRRVRKGPWTVAFTNAVNGAPAVLINQPKVGITNVQLIFDGESIAATNTQGIVIFNQPHPVPYALPFGQCIFMDPTFLPGTLTFNLFGHEIELLPRVLMLDHQEHPWQSGEIIQLPARK